MLTFTFVGLAIQFALGARNNELCLMAILFCRTLTSTIVWRIFSVGCATIIAIFWLNILLRKQWE
jgi:hypothetical protein